MSEHLNRLTEKQLKRHKAEYQAKYWQDNKDRLKARNKEAYDRFITKNPDYRANYYKTYKEL